MTPSGNSIESIILSSGYTTCNTRACKIHHLLPRGWTVRLHSGVLLVSSSPTVFSVIPGFLPFFRGNFSFFLRTNSLKIDKDGRAEPPAFTTKEKHLLSHCHRTFSRNKSPVASNSSWKRSSSSLFFNLYIFIRVCHRITSCKYGNNIKILTRMHLLCCTDDSLLTFFNGAYLL